MSSLRSSLIALALAAGCRGDCEEEVHTFDLELDGTGAAFEIRGRTSDPQEAVFASFTATVANLGSEPCAVSFVTAQQRPSPDLPVRGDVELETVIPGTRDGVVFQRSINANEGPTYEGEEPWGIDLATDDDDFTIGTSLRIATCPDAQLDVELEILTEVCWSLGATRGSIDVTQLW